MVAWGIDKFLTITVDNASSNNGLINFLKRKMKRRKNTILEHDFLHVRCCAHILNLIVCEGLKKIDDSITRIRHVIKFVRSSPSKMAKFKLCVEKEGIEFNGKPCLDVATQWNSTYFMLEWAIQFQKAFERLDDNDTHFCSNLREDEVGEVDEVGEEGEVGDIGEEDEVALINNGKGKERRKTIGPPTKHDWKKARLYVPKIVLQCHITFFRFFICHLQCIFLLKLC